MARAPHLRDSASLGTLAFSLLAIVCVAVSSGCTLCQNCGDFDYSAYGGAWERTKRDSGRVGSVFDPAGARSATLADRDSLPDAPKSPSKGSADASKDDSADQNPNDTDAETAPSDNGSSPSDRPENTPSPLENLNLDDINVESRSLIPPDV